MLQTQHYCTEHKTHYVSENRCPQCAKERGCEAETANLRETARHLAMMGLQSDRYTNDSQYARLVDDILALTGATRLPQGQTRQETGDEERRAR